MKIIDILTSPWAIPEARLKQMIEVYSAHLRGEKADIAAIEARMGRQLSNGARPYQIQDGVAVVEAEGVLSKRMNIFSSISGGTSTQLLARDVQMALADPEVHSIILAIDSPGGEVDGTQAVADLIFAAREIKPIYALADGTMASGGYWIGSAASKVYSSSDTTIVGSIGVVVAHVDYSEREKQQGVKVTEITAGKFKRAASTHAPLNDAGRATLQEQVDHIYSVFVDGVARNRGTDADTVLQDMADGRVFLGKKAVDAGLVDGITTLGALVAQLAGEHQARVINGALAPQRKGAAATMKTFTEQEVADKEQAALVRGRAEGKTEGIAEGKAAGITEGKAAGITEGATQERQRIQAVEAQLMPGHEKLVAELKFDGKTTGPEAAVKVLNAEREKKATVLANLKEDATKPAPSSEAPTTETTEVNPQALADAATSLVAAAAKEGKSLSIADAVHKITQQQKKA